MKVKMCSDRDWLLSKEAYQLYAPCMYQPAYDDFRIRMEDLLKDQSVRVYVSENRGETTGMMVLKLSDSSAEIIGITVSDKLRRQGIGRHLIQFVVESEGVKWIEAQTDDDSVGFYRKCGFTEERIVVDYPDGSVVRYNCILSE